MLRRVILILIGVLLLGGSGEVFAQTKITLDTKSFPEGFEGYDAAVLFDNLNALLKDAKGKDAETVRESLKGKKVYENLTTDDLFAFTLEAADYVAGKNTINNLHYRGVIFPLRRLQDAPPPQRKYLVGLGGGNGSPDPLFSSINELVSPFVNSQPLETLWTTSYLPIKTVFPPEALAKKYAGNKAGCPPSQYVPNSPKCNGRNFNVPSPQIHYGVGFRQAQPFSLVNVTDENLSLQTYESDFSKLPGIVAWLANGEQYSGNTAPIFIVRLIAPYLISEIYETPDAAEQKPHRAVRNILYADLTAIWIYNKSTGAIVSKNGETAVISNSVSGEQKIDAPVAEKIASPNAPLKIISKPPPAYTDEARQNLIEGIVSLKVTFLASGQIGSVKIVEGLRYGLTQQAVKAAQKIKFSPAVKNGMPTTVTKIVEFSFKVF